jgi:glycosyltransferase involved in cell wall biosynthesis
MKIAYLTPEYPHPKCSHSAGVGTSIYNLAHAISKLGSEVYVLVYGQNQDVLFNDEGVHIYKIKNIKLKGFSRWLTQKKIEKIINTLYVQNKIDLVESIDWTGITSFIKPKKCPIIIKLHGSDTYFCKLDGRNLKKNNFYHEKRALKKADAHLSVSDFVAKKTNLFFNLNIDFTTVYNGVDLNRFQSSSNFESFITILYVGTLIRKKGVLDLANIFNEVHKSNSSVKLFLIGQDSSDIQTGTSSTWQLMKNIFTPEALKQVDYRGNVPYVEVKTYLKKTSICVFPSYAEALPVSWLEAMAMGKAIVASNIGWASEIIDDGKEGFLIHPSNHHEFASKINLLIHNKSKRHEFGNQALIKMNQKFSNVQIAHKNLNYYQSVIDKSI